MFVDTLITASPEFFTGRSKQEVQAYFTEAVAFMEKKVGGGNIFSAVVHMDEKTPHLHLCLSLIHIFTQILGYSCAHGPDIQRDYHSPLYEDELLPALRAVNPALPQAALDDAVYKLKNFASGSLLQKNMTFTDYLQNGISVKYFVNGEERSTLVYLVEATMPSPTWNVL